MPPIMCPKDLPIRYFIRCHHHINVESYLTHIIFDFLYISLIWSDHYFRYVQSFYRTTTSGMCNHSTERLLPAHGPTRLTGSCTTDDSVTTQWLSDSRQKGEVEAIIRCRYMAFHSNMSGMAPLSLIFSAYNVPLGATTCLPNWHYKYPWPTALFARG